MLQGWALDLRIKLRLNLRRYVARMGIRSENKIEIKFKEVCCKDGH
jgi:hypothetical protein